MAEILDGRALSKALAEDIKREVARRERRPKLVIIQVGSVPASNMYIKRKIAFGAEVGIPVDHIQFPDTVEQEEIISCIERCNADATIDGIIVQLPLPKHIHTQILQHIDLAKDVDGLVSGTRFVSATTRGILTLLERYSIDLEGKKAVIVGRSALVGIPTALALLRENATVTVCHSHTRNLADETRQADILIAATGKAGLITGRHVREGQVVIDVGGDVDFKSVEPMVHMISPVPGGVGPMTIASLFQNVLDASEHIDI